MLRRAFAPAALLLGALALTGCTPKDSRYESVVQLVRTDVVDEDDKGPRTVDLLMEWDPCPGNHFQIVRGGREFAACTAKYKAGDFVHVVVAHHWDSRGYYDWDLERFGDCKRPIDWDDEGSYGRSAECEDNTAYGSANGFRCKLQPEGALLKVCPWTRRN